MFADELAKMETKFKEQLKTNENLKLQLAAEEDHYKVSSSARSMALRPFAATAGRPLDMYCVPPPPMDMAALAQGQSLMLSLPLNAVTLTVLFISRPICGTTFYCCLCQALETSEAQL